MLRAWQTLSAPTDADRADLAASFQAAATDCLTDRTARAIRAYPQATALVVAGGVASNGTIRAALATLAAGHNLPFVAPPPWLCTDNAAMIAWAGAERFALGMIDGLDAPARARWPLDPGAETVRGAGVQSMTVGVIGGGAWGTALAQVVASGGEDIVLWAREAEVVAAINRDHANPQFLPGIALSPAIHATGTTGDLAAADLWLVVAPAQHLRAVLAECPLASRPALVLCAKGIEAGTLKLMAEIAAEMAPFSPVAVLSGPTFAAEVAAGLPTAVTLACADAAVGQAIAARLARPHFRPYLSDDVTGAEIGGAVKNVLAIACGIVEGAGLGQNARAALIARGFAEMTRFGLARGARADTLAGLSGLGDLVLTCSSEKSRNFTLGVGLGRGGRSADLLGGKASVAEGAATAPVLIAAARACGVDMPVCAAVAAVLAGAPVAETVGALLARPLRAE